MKYCLALPLLAFLSCGQPDYLVSTGQPGPKGEAGTAGASGAQGQPGPAGVGCSITSVIASQDLPYGGAIVTCGDSVVLLSNGIPGANGADGEDGEDGEQGPLGPVGQYSVVEVVDPCDDAPGIYDEVLLRLGNGTLLASFSDNSNGKNTRLSVISAGNYVTTDGSNCYFSVNNMGGVTW